MSLVKFRFRDRLTGRFVGERWLPVTTPVGMINRICNHGYDAEIVGVA